MKSTRPLADDPFMVERREHYHLRTLYNDARTRIAHFFENHADWAGSPIDYLACRLLHETYPELTSHEVVTLVGAIERNTIKEFSQA